MVVLLDSPYSGAWLPPLSGPDRIVICSGRDNDIGLRINDINGSRAAFEDDAMATTRFYRSPREGVLDVWHLGSYLGETGAAAGAIELIWGASMGELAVQVIIDLLLINYCLYGGLGVDCQIVCNSLILGSLSSLTSSNQFPFE